MAVAAKPEVRDIPQVEHGAVSDEELTAAGLLHSQVADFSVNTNPLGPSPRALSALRLLDISRYPEPGSPALRTAIAKRFGLRPENVIVGNGSVELIWLAAMAYLSPGDAVLILGPTFGEYERAARIVGAAVTELRAEAEREFQPDLEAAQEQLRAQRPRLCFICNPNNPTGVYLRTNELEPLFLEHRDTLFVVDEAYLSFVEGPDSLVPLLREGNLLLLRSMTKDYGLAGVRVGYGLAAPEIINALERVQPPWSVNRAAQIAALASLEDEEHVRWGQETVQRAKAYLVQELTALGLKVYPSAANFLLVDVGNAKELRTALLKKGIVVRDCTSFGLPSMVRLGVRPLNRCRMLITALKETLPKVSAAAKVEAGQRSGG